MSGNSYLTVRAQYLTRTPNAICICEPDEDRPEEIWLPLSTVRLPADFGNWIRYDIITFKAQEWIVKKNKIQRFKVREGADVRENI